LTGLLVRGSVIHTNSNMPEPRRILMNYRFETVTTAHRRHPKVKTCMSRVTAFVHKIFFCFFCRANLGEHFIRGGMGFPEVSAQAALPIVDM
jgi:hypothetical protein